MSITLEFDEHALAALPLGPGERERHMQIELACRFYANGWLTLAQGFQMAALDHYAFGVALAERGIPRQYGMTEAMDPADANLTESRGSLDSIRDAERSRLTNVPIPTVGHHDHGRRTRCARSRYLSADSGRSWGG